MAVLQQLHRPAAYKSSCCFSGNVMPGIGIGHGPDRDAGNHLEDIFSPAADKAPAVFWNATPCVSIQAHTPVCDAGIHLECSSFDSVQSICSCCKAMPGIGTSHGPVCDAGKHFGRSEVFRSQTHPKHLLFNAMLPVCDTSKHCAHSGRLQRAVAAQRLRPPQLVRQLWRPALLRLQVDRDWKS